MKPSERIIEIAENKQMFSDVAISWHQWKDSILQYLDEQAEKESKLGGVDIAQQLDIDYSKLEKEDRK